MSAVTAPYHKGLQQGSTEYGTPWEKIVSIVLAHMRSSGKLVKSMIDVRDRYNAEWVLPGFEDLGDLSPMIVADAIDNLGMSAAQVDPAIYCPPIDEWQQNGPGSIEYATYRRKAIAYTWDKSAFDVARGRFYRHLAGYATSSIIAKPDYEAEMMRVVVRDPLTTYCEPKDPEDLTPPAYGAFVYGQSASSLRSQYPFLMKENGGPIDKQNNWQTGDVLWNVVEWWDADCMVLGVIGPRVDNFGPRAVEQVPSARMLFRTPNRMGFCPIVCPTQVTLDRIQSAVFQIIGSSDLMARLRALDVLASEKAIYPDRYVIGREGMTPRLVAGRWIDGREGDTNLVVDATLIGELRGTPDPSGKIAHDRVEGEAKRHVGLTGPMQGDASNPLRTGRALAEMGGYSVDPRMAELHKIGQHAFVGINRAILAGWKGCFGGKKFSMYSGWQGDSKFTFEPDKHIEITKEEQFDYDESLDLGTPNANGLSYEPEQLDLENAVLYPIPGADIVNTTMALSQLRAGGAMSLKTFRRRHPWIPDAELEEREFTLEQLEAGLLQSLMMRMGPQGGMAPMDAAQVVEEYRKSGDVVAATKKADELAAKRQAEQAPPPEPGQVAPPETQPGLGVEGEGRAMQPPAQEFQALPPQVNLSRLTRALRTKP